MLQSWKSGRVYLVEVIYALIEELKGEESSEFTCLNAAVEAIERHPEASSHTPRCIDLFSYRTLHS